ncbi:MAG: hypothetical protein M9939_00615 [Mesorhizobium sp.]|nr:hypothetical protein [Mesorhizobium sp.]MCO5159609.1 hypothetical protein [Mesorhizobium sp.]
MAFNPERLSLVVEPIGGVGLRWFNYQTDESEDDLIAADYLPNAEKYGLRAYDLIFVSPASGTEEPYILTVDTIDADGNATLVNSARFGSDTLSYRDKAAVGRIRVPANADNILVSAYDATVNPSVGRANYRAASDADYAATPALLRLTDASGRKFIINEKRLSPDMAGGDPTGVTGSAAAINAVIDYLRTEIAATGRSYGRYVIDLSGGIYKVESPINATNITSWNLVITNGVLVGTCTGKAVLDLVGSRGYTISNLLIYGDETNMPSIGIYSARHNLGAQACDNNCFDNVSVVGHYSIAADYCYGQESTRRIHCRYYNQNYQGRVGIYTGYVASPPTSDFQTVKTGSVSFGNNSYVNCDWRFLPSSNIAFITQVDKGNPTVIHVTSHPFSNGNAVVFHQFSSLTEFNSQAATISNATATSFEVNIDSTAFTGSGSGITGRVIRSMTQAPILFGRGNQHRFTNCYLASYASSAIEIDFSDGFVQENNTFDFMIEGACPGSHYKFKLAGGARKMRDVKFIGGGTQARLGLFSFDGATGSLALEGADIAIASHQILSTLPLCANPSQLSIMGDILYPNRAGIQASSMASFKGFQKAIDDGLTYYSEGDVDYTPTVTDAIGGAATTATITGNWIKGPDKTRHVSIRAVMTDIGTLVGRFRFTLPANASSDSRYFAYWTGENLTTGVPIYGWVQNGTGYVTVYSAAGGAPCVSGQNIQIAGEYETV